jgi:hypothetical protein
MTNWRESVTARENPDLAKCVLVGIRKSVPGLKSHTQPFVSVRR